jgi:hypothetical protein
MAVEETIFQDRLIGNLIMMGDLGNIGRFTKRCFEDYHGH